MVSRRSKFQSSLTCTRRTSLASLLLVLVAWSPHYVSGFANHLVESASGCMVDLSTDEVIMNHQVVAYEDSSHPELYLAVVMDDGTIVKGPIDVSNSNIDTFTIKLINPNKESKLSDIQYAIETTQGAAFVNGGCDDQKRTSSRMHNDPGVALEIDDAISTTSDTIEVWAGWAAGHEAVQLTDTLVFVRNTSNDGESAELETGKSESASESESEEDPIEEEVIELEEEIDRLAHDPRIDRGGELDQDVDKEYEELLHAEKDALKDLRKVKDLQENAGLQARKTLVEAHADAKEKLKEAALNRRRDFLQDKKKRIDHTSWRDKLDELKPKIDKKSVLGGHLKENLKHHGEYLNKLKEARPPKNGGEREPEVRQPRLTRLEALKRKYDHDEYGEGGEFSLRNHGYGILVFLTSGLCVVQLFLWSSKRGDKGRRDL